MTQDDRWMLVWPHRERLLVIARRRAGDDAEDIVSEAMIRAATFDGLDPERVGQFLTSVVTRLCADEAYRRSLALRKRAAMLPVADDPLAVVLDADEARYLASVRLTERESTILRARMHGLFPSEVAASLGMTIPAAKKALERARRKIVAAWRTTLGVIGALRLRRVLPAGGAMAVALATLVLRLALQAPTSEDVAFTMPRPALATATAAVRPVRSASPVIARANTRSEPRPVAASPGPAPLHVTTPLVGNKRVGVGQHVVVIDASEDPIHRVVRCVRNGMAVSLGQAQVTCRE